MGVVWIMSCLALGIVESNPLETSCDNLDNDFNGQIDEGCDDDQDDYCDANKAFAQSPAACPLGAGDCDDANPSIHPGAGESCDLLDNDCDGLTDEDFPIGQSCEGEGECGEGALECALSPQLVSSSCGNGQGLSAAHSGAGILCEDFDTDRDGDGVAGTFSRLPVSISGSDPLLAFGDPDDDVIGYTAHGGPTPRGVSGRICSTDVSPATTPTCHPVPSENDWHLHSAFEGCDSSGSLASRNSYDRGNPAFANTCAPDERAHSGFRSLHMGRHLNATDTVMDTYRWRQVSAFVLDPVILGTSSTLEFWHAISVADYRMGLPLGLTTAGGQVQISPFNGVTGLYEPWERIAASQNNYAVVDQEQFTVCEFDPGDDRELPLDETMCGGKPQWSHMGDIYGSDLGCVVDSDTGVDANGDCGDVSNETVAASCQWVSDPNCGSFLETGGTGTGLGRGSGVWIRSQFDLQAYAGRKARLRWIFEGGGGWQFGESRSWLEPEPGGSPYFANNRDDGWYVDDIKLTDIREPSGSPGLICSTEPGGSSDESSPEACDGLDHDCDGIPSNPTGSDSDQDGVDDGCDNCPAVYNPGQEDGDGDGTGDACESLLTLVSFEGVIRGGKVVLRWETASEINIEGFNVYRSISPSGPWEKRNQALIPSEGSATSGAVYTFSERKLRAARVLYYLLEHVDLGGTATQHPVIEVVRGRIGSVL